MADTTGVLRTGHGPANGATPAPSRTGGRGGHPPGRAAARAVVAVLALVLGSMCLSGCGASGGGFRAGPLTSPSGSSSAPAEDFTTPVTEDPTEREVPTADAPGADPDPAPAAPPPPPPDRYGAIAVGRDGSNGESWDYSSRKAAEQGALKRCPGSGCKILASFSNSCGAVVHNAATNHYWGGHGATRAEAEADARARAGGGRTLAWACTTRYNTD
ncbi:DUF4189 domain-containing protein [Streptomyces sp. NPDC001741]|uniref:DUF4189 domain-containing protein n=1 Tax=Streptomyces sp. NPDC001741 TaxID=3364605 RepID=UPI0036B69E6E